ncbi:uncharacterized protein BO80DRAFT_503821 [Aspergillus ibericus CBS 121593]|uniref:Uncharacterized protein n=1 Tax=Aspergillus ibericus CBS 121593 TaxID=1448316 RepID=A0A395GVT9_9EURO|nr:hypothetical protein BO80DRAFT_503821 [Aspergillus ibericus CBS 121593]RAK98807.1 hypothetical protein BO80DRAFT_503821 [Aspergillus ibericus CBS 121593]
MPNSSMWFLLPDPQILKHGPIQLGTVLEKPFRPSTILAYPGDGLPEYIRLPRKKCVIEGYHEREYTKGHNTPDGIKVDHEVWTFDGKIEDESLRDILALPRVKAYREKTQKSVFIITTVRITNTPFLLGLNHEPEGSDQDSVPETESTYSAPETESTDSNSYTGSITTAPNSPEAVDLTEHLKCLCTGEHPFDMFVFPPGLVFTYRVHIIRSRGSEVECAEVKGP